MVKLVKLSKRIILSLLIGFVLGALGFVVLPISGRLAEPFLCQGVIEPKTHIYGLQFRCIEAADGRIRPLETGLVMRYTVPVLSFGIMPLAWFALAGAAQRADRARGAMSQDLAVAVAARAEILRIARQASINHQVLVHAAELTLVLWVQPPNGRPYEAQVAWLVDDAKMGRLSVGTVVPVRINPQRPEHVYPAQSWARYAWWD